LWQGIILHECLIYYRSIQNLLSYFLAEKEKSLIENSWVI